MSTGKKMIYRKNESPSSSPIMCSNGTSSSECPLPSTSCPNNLFPGEESDITLMGHGDATKLDGLKEIMNDHVTCENIGSSWRLYLHLLVTDEGRILGTYQDLALIVGRNADTMRKWVSKLQEKGLLEIKPMGKSVELVLTSPSMEIAKAPDYKIREIQTSQPDDSPQLNKCRIMVEACNASGSTIWMKIEPIEPEVK